MRLRLLVPSRSFPFLALLCAALLAVAPVSSAAQAPRQAPALKILVLEGEDAVNIVQQRTAVAPVVEVRDRNDQPVAGVIVRFAVTKGRATFSGARTLSIATNAAGRAAATGFTPTGAGALQLTASATFQGQTIAATIAQTNVLTAAEAATASAAGSSGAGGSGAAGAAGGGSGGGLSATTIGIVGGAAAGGAIAAKEVLGGSGGGTSYSGAFSGPLTEVWAVSGCNIADVADGTIDMNLDVASDGSLKSGDAEIHATLRRVSLGANCQGFSLNDGAGMNETTSVQGTSAALSFRKQVSNSVQPSATHTFTIAFSGALSGSQISGTVTVTDQLTVSAQAGSAVFGSGTAAYPIILK